MRHICYTLATQPLPTLATLFLHNIGNQKCATFATLCYTFLSHNWCPLWLHFPFPHLVSTFATLLLHIIGNQKCATFVTLWLHNHFPHLLHFSYTTLVIKNAPHLLHFGYTLSYTYIPHLVHYIGNQKCITSAALSLYSACPNFHYTFPKLPLHHPQSLP